MAPGGSRTKTLYWIRHAQSRHNVTQEAAEEELLERFPGTVGGATKAGDFPGYREARKAAMFTALNGDAVFDSPLTAEGVEQAEALRPQAEQLVREGGVELVLTSSLRRTTLTAVTAFGGLVPVVALDELREVAGAFDCERRAALSEQVAMFPKVDFSSCSSSDVLWVQFYRDANAQAVARGVEVLDLIMDRPEQVLAVVSHGAFSSGAVFGSPHPRIRSSCSPPRLNCEVRGVVISRADGNDGVFTLAPLEDNTAARL
jgi:broad specificity phosphatase PhoE